MFYGDSMLMKGPRFLKKLNKGRYLHGAYLICLSESPEDPLEFFSTSQLLQPHYKSCPPDISVCGLAKDRDEAIMVVEHIIDAAEAEGCATVRSFVEGLFT